MTWQVHIRAGLHVCASGPADKPGTVVTLRNRVGPVPVSASCRVGYVVSEPQRRGFAYGTLAAHPESGEEAFLVEQDDSDLVTFTITAFSRPATWLARAAGPVEARVQRRITRRYLDALATS
jgi:uncharacterized protein (UPF0548 family)